MKVQRAFTDAMMVSIPASIGVATLPDAADSAEELLRCSDTAMYRVKDAGGDGIQVAERNT